MYVHEYLFLSALAMGLGPLQCDHSVLVMLQEAFDKISALLALMAGHRNW